MIHQSSGPQSIRVVHLEFENAALQARIRELEANYEYQRTRCEAKESELADICAALKVCPWPPYGTSGNRNGYNHWCQSCGYSSESFGLIKHKPDCPVSALEQIKSKLR